MFETEVLGGIMGSIKPGVTVCESTLWGDRMILVLSEPDARGYYDGTITDGPDAGPGVFCFNVLEARYVTEPTPGQIEYMVVS